MTFTSNTCPGAIRFAFFPWRASVEDSGIRNVCLAGGVALNCVTNTRVLRGLDLTGLYVQPAASDVGQSLGNALWAFNCVLRQDRGWRMRSAELGTAYGPQAIEATMEPFRGEIWARTLRSQRAARSGQRLVPG
jgi:predicted NodU family carbamoyl transferase